MFNKLKSMNDNKVFKGYLNIKTLEEINKKAGTKITSIYKKPLVINNKLPKGIILVQKITGETNVIRLHQQEKERRIIL